MQLEMHAVYKDSNVALLQADLDSLLYAYESLKQKIVYHSLKSKMQLDMYMLPKHFQLS